MDTFIVLGMAFIPSTPTFVRHLASGGQVGLCRCLAPSLVCLCDGYRISRIRQAAEAFLRAPVKLLRLEVVRAEGRRGAGRFLGFSFRLVLLNGVVYIGGFQPAGWSKGVKQKVNMNNKVCER